VLSPDEVNYSIEPLSSAHNRANFCCGVESLDRYFQQQASQDQRKYVAAPFVVFDLERNKVIGYYTLSATSINLEELPKEIAKKLPKYPSLPAILLGRLAVDRDYQKQGWGDFLVMDALARSLRNEIAAIAVVVDAIDESAVAFYEYYQFLRFPERPNRLFLPMKTIQAMQPDE
jgi:ribosomal protein S18 acetylase RimI-like enzyme